MLRKIARIIAAGLELSARATALREGLPWESPPRQLPGQSSTGLMRGQCVGAVDGAPGWRARIQK
jgi:hypothetical protein